MSKALDVKHYPWRSMRRNLAVRRPHFIKQVILTFSNLLSAVSPTLFATAVNNNQATTTTCQYGRATGRTRERQFCCVKRRCTQMACRACDGPVYCVGLCFADGFGTRGECYCFLQCIPKKIGVAVRSKVRVLSVPLLRGFETL